MGNGSGNGDAMDRAAEPLILGERLDLSTVGALAARIEERRGADLTIDAAQVDHVGALGAQLLVAAHQQWRADGLHLVVAPRSAAFESAIGLLGLSDQLAAEGAQ